MGGVGRRVLPSPRMSQAIDSHKPCEGKANRASVEREPYQCLSFRAGSPISAD